MWIESCPILNLCSNVLADGWGVEAGGRGQGVPGLGDASALRTCSKDIMLIWEVIWGAYSQYLTEETVRGR